MTHKVYNDRLYTVYDRDLAAVSLFSIVDVIWNEEMVMALFPVELDWAPGVRA